MPAYKFKAELVRVVDGDTVKFRADLGFRMSFTDNFRLVGINAPELREPGGEDSKKYLESLLMTADDIYIIVNKHGKYRWLCRINAYYGNTMHDINEKMVTAGFATAYKKGKS